MYLSLSSFLSITGRSIFGNAYRKGYYFYQKRYPEGKKKNVRMFFFSDSGYRIEKVTKSYKEWNFLRNFPMSRGFSENYSQKCDFSVTILHKSIYPKISKRAK